MRVLVLIVLTVLAGRVAAAPGIDPRNLVIRNVVIPVEKAEVAPVHLLIRDNRLELVTEDPIPLPEGAVALDASGGYVIGHLQIGEAPGFLILDGNPREDVGVLLDTRSHTLFAIRDGELLRNELPMEPVHEEPPGRAGGPKWLAYTPPPFAIPARYSDPSRWNRWQTERTSGLFSAAVVLDRQRWTDQNGDSETLHGDLKAFDGGEIRGLRFGVVGTLNRFERPWVYTVFGATNGFTRGFDTQEDDDYSWFDYRLDVPVSDNVSLSVGKQKEPISLERVTSMIQLPMQERSSVSDAFLPSRNLGVVLSGSMPQRHVTWATGIFNNFIDSDESVSDTPTQWIGRITWLPFISLDEGSLIHLGAGVRLSDGKLGARFRTEPEFDQAPTFVDTGFIDSDGNRQFNVELGLRRGPVWIAGEYVHASVDSPTHGDLDFGGYHASVSWILSGEMRAYNHKSGVLGPVPIARSVDQGGWGAWELGARYSSIDLVDGSVDGGEMDISSLGINWWLSPTFGFNLNYRFIDSRRAGLDAEAEGMLARVVLILD